MRMIVDGQTERLAALRLARTERIGAKTYLALVNRFGSPSAALKALPGLSRRGGRSSPPKIPSEQDVEAEFDGVVRLGARMIALGEADYPEPLSHID
ncbi:MAG: DNA-protecting protein DprA, partial [Pseudomonadota bacterium]